MTGMLEGKVAIVTGAGSGIGEAAALIMAREGAKVAVADILPEGGLRTVTQIVEAGGEATFVPTDVSKEGQVANLVERAVATWGRLDCAFNNAGFGNIPVPTAELEELEWNRVLAVVLNGVFLCMKHEIRAMLKTGGGAIVNTSSNSGIRGIATQSAYCAAKAGVIGVTRTTAVEYARQGIRVNAICPGLIMTPLIRQLKEEGHDWESRTNIPMGRGGEPSEIGSVAAWLCSSGASYLTGQAISVGGGNSVV